MRRSSDARCDGRGIAANIARLPELLKCYSVSINHARHARIIGEWLQTKARFLA